MLGDVKQQRKVSEVAGKGVSNSQLGMEALLPMVKTMVEGIVKPKMEMVKSHNEGSAGKRKRDTEEDDKDSVETAGPTLITLENHTIKDNAHDVIDWEIRKIRPYNGGDWETYWAKQPVVATPILEDVSIEHLTKAPINPM